MRVIRLYVSLPKTTEAQVIGKQVLRSGTSIGAHYAESQRAKSDADFINKFQTALQELDETIYWLELIVEANIYNQERVKPLIDETNELIAIFTTIVKKIKDKKNSSCGVRIFILHPSYFKLMNTNPARGMRDFLPVDVRKREYVIGIIKEVYQKYGFEPLETPSVENLETLMGKYGEEGNQLIFKILERGEKIQKKLAEGAIKSENELSDLALRYDLTVPLARVVANYKDKLPKFFKRYQIQPVWRADRPARGRFREFYQCDVDAIGSSSMVVEAELISAVCEILERLGFDDFVVKINHRKLLTQIVNKAGISQEKTTDALVALDKLDKIGKEGVEKELIGRGIGKSEAELFVAMFEGFESLEEANQNLNKIGFDLSMKPF